MIASVINIQAYLSFMSTARLLHNRVIKISKIITYKYKIFGKQANYVQDSLHQAWATSGPPAIYGPRSTLMWPGGYIWGFLNSYIDCENTLNIKKVPVLSQKQP